jgi:hypothetical protein
MRHAILLIIFFSCLAGNCQTVNSPAKKSIIAPITCSTGLMKRAGNEYGMDEPVPPIKGLANDFIILVDPKLKASNFISFEEQCYRHQSNDPDTFRFKYVNELDWNTISPEKKFAIADSIKSTRKRMADSVHVLNNKGENQVWIINNTPNVVSVQMQDWLFICILQGLTKDGQWLPIQYWQFSGCGNSYHNKEFAPKTANSFLFTIPNKGNYQTKLRFKLLGADRFYYSNEFTGKIDYCQFVENSPEPNYKLDSMIQLRPPRRRL